MDNADAADTGDRQWLTYGQLAEARQIGRRAAVRLAQRHRLRRQPGNDGTVRVWVPADMAASSPFRPHPPATPATPDAADADDTKGADAAPFHSQALAALEDALRAADARADAALALANTLAAELADAGVRADHERQRADALHTGLATAETAITELRAGLAVAEHDAQAALEAAEALRQAEAERKARGLVARLRAAWRGE